MEALAQLEAKVEQVRVLYAEVSSQADKVMDGLVEAERSLQEFK